MTSIEKNDNEVSKTVKGFNSLTKTLTEKSGASASNTQVLPYSVAKVRHSRVKIEKEVLQMHNRISLLE